AFGHCRLCTTEESLSETQPLCDDEGGLMLVMDGTLDNWSALRGQLMDQGVRPRGSSDAELVLRSYQLWGEDCLDRIEGDFAIAIWDQRRRRLFCARDRSGIKVLHYHWNGRRLVFATDLHAILADPDLRPEMNEGMLAEFLSMQLVSNSETLWRDVLRLPGAHAMTVDAAGPRVSRYWRPEDIAAIRYRRDAEYVEHYRQALTRAVQAQARSHGPVGFEVSGGLDSSSLFALGDGLVRRGELCAPDIRAFTLDYPPGTPAYEVDYAREVCAHAGRGLSAVPPTIWSVERLLAEAARVAGVPNLPNGIMHLGMFADLRAAGGRVMLNGDGGDQWLDCGDSDMAESLRSGDLPALGVGLRADLAARGPWRTLYRALRHGLYPMMPDPLRRVARGLLLREEISQPFWLAPRLRDLLEERRLAQAEANARRLKGLRIGLRDRILALDGAYPAFAREVSDRMAASQGIDYRAPMFNRAYLDCVLGFPLSQMRRGEVYRHVHRQAMTGLLPERVVRRDTKAEFSVIETHYAAGLARHARRAASRHGDWFAPEGLARVVANLSADTPDPSVWSCGILTAAISCLEVSN
ncbi:MAG: asparagine synthetase B, partial [Rhodobacteraceae bacterium]